jgi:hypothetical protein
MFCSALRLREVLFNFKTLVFPRDMFHSYQTGVIQMMDYVFLIVSDTRNLLV